MDDDLLSGYTELEKPLIKKLKDKNYIIFAYKYCLYGIYNYLCLDEKKKITLIRYQDYNDIIINVPLKTAIDG